MDKKDKYWQLFLSTFKLSACTFGGGFVIIPLMRERFVKELHWIEEEEMLDLTAIAQSSPGSIAINASILVGYHVAGIPGALITVVGAALPPLIIISIISAFYQAFRSNKYVSMAMVGMLAGVAAVIFDVVINMAWPILKRSAGCPSRLCWQLCGDPFLLGEHHFDYPRLRRHRRAGYPVSTKAGG